MKPRCPPHYWIIESPHGPTSRGKCKWCKAKKDFPNAHVERGYNHERHRMADVVLK